MVTPKALINHYRKYFCVVRADSPELRNLAYHLRYKVYIEECGYQIGKNDTEKIEKDDYDDYSLHSLLFHTPSKQAIGYVRLIPFDKDNFDVLPLEKYCKKSFKESTSLATLRTPETGEISRMALLPSFRRRVNDTSIQGGDLYEQNTGIHSRFPINYLPICLSLMSINLMYSANLTYSVAMMDERLALLIKRFGIKHEQIGEFVDYHGLRAPYMIFPQETYDFLKPEYQELFNLIHDEFNSENISIETL